MYTLKASSSGAKFRPSDLLHEGLRGQRPDAAHRLRGKAGVGVRYQTQANVRASSGMRGMAHARRCGAEGRGAPAACEGPFCVPGA